jgi:hypothetical protein
MDNSFFERVEELEYLGRTLTNHGYAQEEIKSRLKEGNACYHSVQNLLSSSLLFNIQKYTVKIKIYISIILMIVSYGCETWSLTLWEEGSLKVLENRVLKRVFGPKSDDVTGEWKKVRNEELSDLYSSPNVIREIKSRRMIWSRHVARMGERRGAYRFLVGKLEGKRQLGSSSCRWEDNI